MHEQGVLGNLKDLPKYPEAQSLSNPEFNLLRNTMVSELGPVFIDGMIIEVPHILERDLLRLAIALDQRISEEVKLTRYLLNKAFDTVVQDLVVRKTKENSTIYFLRFMNNDLNQRLLSRLELMS